MKKSLTVRLVHHSVKNFLAGFYTFTGKDFEEDANQFVADVVITYLNYRVFDSQVSVADTSHMFGESITSGIIQSTLDSRIARILR